jgi:hypothetical protein
MAAQEFDDVVAPLVGQQRGVGEMQRGLQSHGIKIALD